MIRMFLAALAACLLCVGVARAADQLTPEQKAEVERLIKLRDSLKPIHGVVTLGTANARLNLGSGYYFLGAADAKRVLTEAWGNPPSSVEDVIGLIFPEGKMFADDSWGAVVTFAPSGYVNDKDAKTADYDKLLRDMQSGEDDLNAQRKKDGFDPQHLVGWAQAPSYDPARHDLIWAREFQFGDQEDHTLNYDVRHLGRRGVLSLNMVSTMSQLPSVRTAAQQLAQTAEFEDGYRYAEFKSGDKTAGYGLAGLVAAGAGLLVAKKVGLIGVILLFAKKGIAIILAAAAGGWAWLRRVFGRKPREPAPQPATGPVAAAIAEAETPSVAGDG
ncbi:MAG: DUF2167 domain-containing protein [Caulobacterales bacterium]|nr:DUF2167 domain-containing protein [Caulobacterales bacterium]